jgi:hypothetical protein
MLFVKILFLLVVRVVLSQNVWHVYVDVEMSNAVRTMQQYGTSLAQRLRELVTAETPCRSIDPHISVTRHQRPCGVLKTEIARTWNRQPQRKWTIISPKVLWIELRVNNLDIPLSDPDCSEANILLMDLLGDPTNMRYCGRRPQEVLYSTPKLTIVLSILRLQANAKIHLEYEFVSPKPITYFRRLPVILPTLCRGECRPSSKKLVLRNLPMHRYDLISKMCTYSLLLPFLSDTYSMKAEIMSTENCDYVIYDGPGTRSPVMANSATQGPRYTFETHTTFYMEFFGIRKECEDTVIKTTINVINTLYISKVPLVKYIQQSQTEPVVCFNAHYTVMSVHHEVEFHINSSENTNTWCRIQLRYHRLESNRSMSFEMDFDGPNQFLMYDGASACQFGGTYIFSSQHSQAFCESLSGPPETMSST